MKGDSSSEAIDRATCESLRAAYRAHGVTLTWVDLRRGPVVWYASRGGLCERLGDFDAARGQADDRRLLTLCRRLHNKPHAARP